MVEAVVDSAVVRVRGMTMPGLHWRALMGEHVRVGGEVAAAVGAEGSDEDGRRRWSRSRKNIPWDLRVVVAMVFEVEDKSDAEDVGYRGCHRPRCASLEGIPSDGIGAVAIVVDRLRRGLVGKWEVARVCDFVVEVN